MESVDNAAGSAGRLYTEKKDTTAMRELMYKQWRIDPGEPTGPCRV
jgi:hypothetical protein